MPRISIALPCYNGEQYLLEALQDLRNQTYQDFEVIIYDNASTDGTFRIASEFAAQDPRFRVVRRPVNIPIYQHFRQTLDENDSEYFMWRADDDLTAPNYIETLVACLDNTPKATLAAAHIAVWQLNKHKLSVRPVPPALGTRLTKTILAINKAHASTIYGLYRRKNLLPYYDAVIDKWPQNLGADYAYLFSLLLHDEVVFSGDTYFVQRTGGDPKKAGKIYVPSAEQWTIFRAFLNHCWQAIDQSPFNGFEKAVLKLNAVRHAFRRTYRARKMLWTKLNGR